MNSVGVVDVESKKRMVYFMTSIVLVVVVMMEDTNLKVVHAVMHKCSVWSVLRRYEVL